MKTMCMLGLRRGEWYSFDLHAMHGFRWELTGCIFCNSIVCFLFDSFPRNFGCNNPNLPDVYQRTATQYEWLLLTVCENSAAVPESFDCPSVAPSVFPSDTPSLVPSDAPSLVPSDSPSMLPSDTPTVLPNIPGVAVAAGSFTTLVAALGAADLVDTLSGEGPFTVFAPTDAAFGNLPDGLVSCLLLESNVDVLSGILRYHVVAGKVLSTDLQDGMMAPTLNDGSSLLIDLSAGVKIGTAFVEQANVPASNGVIHVIDSVLVPPGVDVGAFLAGCPA